jgi:hypothetical protein
LSVIPDRDFKEKFTPAGWSYIGFSYMTTLSVSLIISCLTGTLQPASVVTVSVLILTLPLTALHILLAGKDFMRSHITLILAEVILYISYLVLAALTFKFSSGGLIIASSVTGIILIVLTDMGYFPYGTGIKNYMHSGQNLLTALIIVSFLSELKAPFIFVAAIKLILNISSIYRNKLQNVYFSLRVLRTAFLIIAGMSLVTCISYKDPAVTIVFLTGELFDRIIFYNDTEIIDI